MVLRIINIGFKLDFTNHETIITTVMVNSQRYAHGHLLEINQDRSPFFDVIHTTFVKWFKATNEDLPIPFNTEYIHQVFTPYVHSGVVHNYDQLLALRQKDKQLDFALNFLDFYINDLSKSLNISVDMDSLLLHIYGTSSLKENHSNAHFIIYNQNQYFINIIKYLLPKTYNRIHLAITSYCRILDLLLTDKIINNHIYVLLTNWENLLGELIDRVRQSSILVISDRHSSHAKMIKHSLIFAIGNHTRIDIYDKEHISVDYLNSLEYDIIVSTFSLPSSVKQETIVIEHFPTSRDLDRIERVIFKDSEVASRVLF